MNLFEYETPLTGEKFTTLFKHKNIKIVRIVSSNTFKSEEYCQEEDEWVVLLEGEATLYLNEERKVLKKGESLFIPALTKHHISSMQQGTLWLTLHIF